MKRKLTVIKNSLTNNFSLKILALVLSIFLWLAVVNVSDPEKTVTFYNIPITITHESALAKANLVYKVKSKTYVNVTVSGKRSVVSDLKNSDFDATASLAEMSTLNSVPVIVELKERNTARRVNIVRQSMHNIILTTEKMDKKTFDLGITYDGVPMEGFIVSEYSLSKDKVTVKAPVSIMKKVANVMAVCKLNGDSQNTSKKCDVKLFDNSGNVIEADSVKISNKKVQASINVVPSKEIPIKISTQGKVAKGYAVTATTISPETVYIYGKNNYKINNISELNITDAIDVSNATKNITKRIELTSYLPYNVAVANSIEYAEVIIEISKVGKKTITIPSNQIKIKNLSNGSTVNIEGDSYIASIEGKSSTINKLKMSDMEFSIDANKIKNKKVKLELRTIDGVKLEKTVNIKVKVN